MSVVLSTLEDRGARRGDETLGRSVILTTPDEREWGDNTAIKRDEHSTLHRGGSRGDNRRLA